jgi:hypothetical protein
LAFQTIFQTVPSPFISPWTSWQFCELVWYFVSEIWSYSSGYSLMKWTLDCPRNISSAPSRAWKFCLHVIEDVLTWRDWLC